MRSLVRLFFLGSLVGLIAASSEDKCIVVYGPYNAPYYYLMWFNDLEEEKA
jgi:hypothetical protein